VAEHLLGDATVAQQLARPPRQAELGRYPDVTESVSRLLQHALAYLREHITGPEGSAGEYPAGGLRRMTTGRRRRSASGLYSKWS
jgi:hypothetical protein